MQGVSTTGTVNGFGGYVNIPTSYHLYRVLRHLARACWYASHTICVVMGTLTPCLENSSIIPCGCLMFYQFCHLVYPFATAYFHKLSSLLRIHPSLLLVCKGVLPLTGAPLDDSTSMLFVHSGAPANVFIYSAYSTSTGSPVPPLRLSVSPGGFIPDAANTSGNL
jgi:hypothetical protein